MRKSALARDDRDMAGRTPELPRQRVEADLRRRIAAGEWQRGEALPGVPALAAHYGVARATVSRAIHALAGDGLVQVVPRWGTFRA
jgi:DNA-binding GntR family transcriptional regulator